ncbi:DnaD domain-containing protein [Planomicrobium okeanokoites]|uniref:DnaD domain-containing protein n=1 Tax=Planomicrobium okeanokoites TaxID=244 RepID=UPI0009FF2362|nr:DnaD domain protein [Planomicrobium okeanokoites]
MQGWIKMHRKILENDLWHDITAFRLFTLLLLKASHKDGVKTAGIEVNRGQYLRSYSKLSEDLEYLDGRSRKKVPKSTIERKVKKLVDAGIVSVCETFCGTLFTINKYESYQGNDEPQKPDDGTDSETLAGRTRDDGGTNARQEQELKNLRIKELSNTTTTTQPEDGFAIALQTFEANLCKLSPIQMNSLGIWLDDFNQQLAIIEEAIKIAADRNRKNFGFVEYLFKEWTDNKLTTIEQIQSHERNKFNKQQTTYQNRSNSRKPLREERVPEWLGKPEEESLKETVPSSVFNFEAEKQKLLDKLAARKEANQ